MNDDRHDQPSGALPGDHGDDLVVRASAHLDGEADGDASPEFDDTVTEFRRVRALLAGLPAQPAPVAEHAVVDAAVAAALEVYDSEVVPALVTRSDATVTSITAARRWQRRTTAVMSAAAAVLLVVVAAASFGVGSGSDDMASDAGAELSESRMAADGVEGGGTAEATASPVDAMSTTPVDTIGTIIGPASVPTVIDDPALLLELASQVLGPSWLDSSVTLAPPSTDLDIFGCTPTLAPTQVIFATITWIDQPALAVADPATMTVSAIDLGCTVIASATYAG